MATINLELAGLQFAFKALGVKKAYEIFKVNFFTQRTAYLRFQVFGGTEAVNPRQETLPQDSEVFEFSESRLLGDFYTILYQVLSGDSYLAGAITHLDISKVTDFDEYGNTREGNDQNLGVLSKIITSIYVGLCPAPFDKPLFEKIGKLVYAKFNTEERSANEVIFNPKSRIYTLKNKSADLVKSGSVQIDYSLFWSQLEYKSEIEEGWEKNLPPQCRNRLQTFEPELTLIKELWSNSLNGAILDDITALLKKYKELKLNENGFLEPCLRMLLGQLSVIASKMRLLSLDSTVRPDSKESQEILNVQLPEILAMLPSKAPIVTQFKEQLAHKQLFSQQAKTAGIMDELQELKKSVSNEVRLELQDLEHNVRIKKLFDHKRERAANKTKKRLDQFNLTVVQNAKKIVENIASQDESQLVCSLTKEKLLPTATYFKLCNPVHHSVTIISYARSRSGQNSAAWSQY